MYPLPMKARCPSCKEPGGDAVEKEVLDGGGLSVVFECGECGERWNVVF